mmetsp:Transcript_19997/g.59576  ORF Transcript_19997/g.59576 Transcript_19997/m.59576 type:complete len:402 (-) Transcript_19997:26-1231(-)
MKLQLLTACLVQSWQRSSRLSLHHARPRATSAGRAAIDDGAGALDDARCEPLDAAAAARFDAWAARAQNSTTYTVADVPTELRDARLRHFGATTAFPELVTTNAANRACKAGRLLCNGEVSTGARVVKAGDVLTLEAPRDRRTAVPADDTAGRWVAKRCRLLAALRDDARHAPPLEVLFEDDAFAVVLKPAGVHSMSWKGTLRRNQLCLDDVLPLVLAPPAAADALPAPLPCHRLDARVAGPVVVAKTRRAHVSLCRQFEAGTVEKEYRAIVVGAAASGTVEQPVDGLPARTVATALGETRCAVDGVLTDVALRPKTGRRHQLRRHCAEALHAPILGDDLYGAGARRGIGLYLYCRRVAVAHPLLEGRPVACEIAEPRRFTRHRAKARKGWAWEVAQGGGA